MLPNGIRIRRNNRTEVVEITVSTLLKQYTKFPRWIPDSWRSGFVNYLAILLTRSMVRAWNQKESGSNMFRIRQNPETLLWCKRSLKLTFMRINRPQKNTSVVHSTWSMSSSKWVTSANKMSKMAPSIAIQPRNEINSHINEKCLKNKRNLNWK